MTDNVDRHVHPDLLTGVRVVLKEVLGELDLLDLKACRDELARLTHEFKDMAQKYDLAISVSKMRGDELARANNINEQLRDELAKMNARLVLMESALVNIKEEMTNGHDEANEVTAGDDERFNE